MDKEFFENAIKNFPSGPIEYANLAQIKPEVFEERHVKLTLPFFPVHVNHVGTIYAGSLFVFAEIAGAQLFKCTYGTDKWVPILKSVEVDYLKPCTKELVIDISLTKEEAVEKIALAEERGRGDYFLDVPIHDIDGLHVATAKFNYYAIQKK